jgi:hypothetical protein
MMKNQNFQSHFTLVMKEEKGFFARLVSGFINSILLYILRSKEIKKRNILLPYLLLSGASLSVASVRAFFACNRKLRKLEEIMNE